jgi:gas vesicle protein
MHMNKKQKKVAVGVGVGLTAIAAAAAAGTYFFGGKRGAKNRAKVSKWAEDAKNDVVKQVKGLKKVTQKSYADTVDAVMAQYKKAKKMSPQELTALASELKGHWDSIAAEVSSTAKKVTPVVKKAVKAVKAATSKPVAKKAPVKKAPTKKRQ